MQGIVAASFDDRFPFLPLKPDMPLPPIFKSYAEAPPQSLAQQSRTGLECLVKCVAAEHEPDRMMSMPVSARQKESGPGRGGMQG